MTRYPIAALFLFGAASAALAQVGAPPQTSPIVYPASASLSVTTSTANVALPNAPVSNANAYPHGLVTNVGSSLAYYVKGASGVTATTGGIPVQPGQCVPDWFGPPAINGTAPTNIAAITGTGTAALLITQATSEQQCGGGPSAVTGTFTPAPASPVAAVVSTTAESSHVLKGSAGSILSLAATSATAGYVMLFNATSAPADGAVVPIYCWQGPVSGSWPIPVPFSTGITVVYSTTGCATKTASATAWFSAQVQ